MKMKMKPTPLAVLRELVKLSNDFVAYPSQQYIADKLNVCRATVNRCVQTFKKDGVLTVIKSKTADQKFANNTYFLNFFFDALKEDQNNIASTLESTYNSYFEKAIAEAEGGRTDFYDRTDIDDETLEHVIESIRVKTGLKTISVLNVIMNISEKVKTTHIANLKNYIEKSFQNAIEEQGLRESVLSIADIFLDSRTDILIAEKLQSTAEA
jgi:biotin operon repressor